MRLTLRTLLAYLDDTMDPAEIKQFGQRVGESETAQELIARIRQITRRRRLTAPPSTGPGAFDPNTVAEYLDNELPNEQVAELEKTCLESDVHLAEIAASHQILTLVLGQPALVPPMARERMYSLVQGREAIPFRKVAAPVHESSHLDEDDYDPSSKESGLLTMPIFRKPKPWLRWAIPAAAVILLIGVGYALMQALPDPRHRGQVANNTRDKEKDKEGQEVQKDGSNPPPKPPVVAPPKGEEIGEPKKKPDDPGQITTPKPPPPKDPTPIVTPPVIATKKPAPPSTERTDIGIYQSQPGSPSILLQQGANGWKRLEPDKAVYTNEPLVSLPGFASEVVLNTKVHLLLRGNIPEFSQIPLMDALMDSAVILHATKEFDLDLTLLRGRIFIWIGDQPSAKVRLRFEGEVWDLTLKEPRTEIGVDLVRLWTADSDWKTGQPRAEAALIVLRGESDLHVDSYHTILLKAPPGQAMYFWNNEGPGDTRGQPAIGPQFISDQIASELALIWSKDPPIAQWKKKLNEAKEKFSTLPADQSRDAKNWMDYLGPKINAAVDMEKKLKVVSINMAERDKPISVMLMEGCQPSRDLAERLLCIYAMGALDEVGRLFDVLYSETPSAAPDRDAAILVLRRWISRSGDQTKKLYHDDIMGKGGILLNGNRFTPQEANIVITLLHDFPTEDSHKRETFELLSRYLSSDKLPIRELAYWHLRRLAQGVNLEPFNPLAPKEIRAAWIEKLDKMIEEKALPPRSQDPVPAPKK